MKFRNFRKGIKQYAARPQSLVDSPPLRHDGVYGSLLFLVAQASPSSLVVRQKKDNKKNPKGVLSCNAALQRRVARYERSVRLQVLCYNSFTLFLMMRLLRCLLNLGHLLLQLMSLIIFGINKTFLYLRMQYALLSW